MDRWTDDVRDWPKLEFQDIYDYFITAPACDDQPNRNFRSISEGMNYLHSGWVGVIRHRYESKEDNIMCLMAEVRFSQTISQNHKVEMTVNKNLNKITTVKCNCIAGEGKCCSHVAGLAFKVNEAYKKGYIGIACTDQSCVWNASTQQNVLPDSVENIKSSTSEKSTFNRVMAFETDEHLKQHLVKPAMHALASIPGTLLNEMLTAKPRTIQVTVREEPHVHGEHVEDMSQCEPCRDTFEKHVHVTTVAAETLATQTLNQNSALWTSQRKLRITSSSAATVPKKVTTDSSKWIKNHLNPSFFGNDATRHGQQHEGIAREQFEKETGKKVDMAGLVIQSEESWLGASLDGVIDDETILEIKCPTDRKLAKYDGSVRGLIESKTYDVRHMDGKYVLRQTTAANGYYTQVQVAMYCSGRTKCKFMVWCKKDFVIVDVPFDDIWFQQRLSLWRNFYFTYLLPAITDSIKAKQIKVVKPFVV